MCWEDVVYCIGGEIFAVLYRLRRINEHGVVLVKLGLVTICPAYWCLRMLTNVRYQKFQLLH